jgi:prepilin-type N-terminal cleavage/methylation domain-containing protein
MTSSPRGRLAGPGRDFARRRGFTLLELLLVLVVVSIAFGIAVPLFLRSFQGHRLRTAGRAMTMVAKYAKNMAVLKQRDLVLRFDLAAGQVDLVSPDASLPGFSRSVEGVALAWVRRDGQDPVQEGTSEIVFFRNGTCQPFSLCIRDPSGNAVELKVDAVGEVRSVSREAE